jgi:hypothetical protein
MLHHIAFFIVAVTLFVMALFMPEKPVGYDTAMLSGVVVDAETDAPVSGATVILVGGEHDAVTDENGLFTFEEVIPGNYELEVEAEDYAMKNRGVELGLESKEITVELRAGF